MSVFVEIVRAFATVVMIAICMVAVVIGFLATAFVILLFTGEK